jgi:UDP-N-acetylglucosamine:LPS N-acetylglucosamine transferase
VPTIDFIYFDAGGGHRAAATALKAAIEQRKIPWTVRLVNLQEVLDSMDIFRKVTGLRLEDLYNQMLKKGWTLGSAQMLRVTQLVIRVYHRQAVKLLEKHWRATRPDLVVSLVPNFNRPMFESVRKALPGVNYVTILTDFADYPPHFWIEKQDQYFVCGTRRAVEQVKAAGHPDSRIFATSGMIVRPIFYEQVKVDYATEIKKLGLDPTVPTGLVLFGGQGSGAMRTIAQKLSDAEMNLQLILICGRNEQLTSELRSLRTKIKMRVEGFTNEVPYFMQLSDFMIGKPGPGSISEAMAMKLPVIVESNAWTMPQEVYNTEWVRETGTGIVLKSFRQIEAGVRELLEPGKLDDLRAHVAAIENRAVWEIPDILAKLLH